MHELGGGGGQRAKERGEWGGTRGPVGDQSGTRRRARISLFLLYRQVTIVTVYVV